MMCSGDVRQGEDAPAETPHVPSGTSKVLAVGSGARNQLRSRRALAGLPGGNRRDKDGW
jgi:hypothetical protein